MDGDENESSLDNKMLYELHTIHSWQKLVSNKKPNALEIASLSLNYGYEWINANACQTFSTCSLNPSVSFDGEFIALINGASLEIRNKSSAFSIYAEIEAPHADASQLAWSQNSYHLGVCTLEGDIVIYTEEGGEEMRVGMLGFRMRHLVVWETEGVHVLVLSDDGTQLCHIGSDKKKLTFDFEYAASQFFRLSGDVILTTHLASNGEF